MLLSPGRRWFSNPVPREDPNNPVPTGHRFEMEFLGTGFGWTDVTQDVMVTPSVSAEYGMSGADPLALVAGTGRLSFAMNNSESNSASLLGYYTPGHANCRSGFKHGIRVRYKYRSPENGSIYVKFIGRLKSIDPKSGQFLERKTRCSAADWMDIAANFNPLVATQVNKKINEIVQSLIDAMPEPPTSTQFSVGDSVFPYSLDNSKSEGTPALSEFQRLAQSEFGRIYLRGGLNSGGILVVEKRSQRLTPMPVATFNGTMQEVTAAQDAGKIKNSVKVTGHPRTVDSVNTIVLFSKPATNNPSVAPGQTLTIVGRFNDPSNRSSRVGGTDMIAPVATTDFLMNSAADGSGSNLTASFAVVAIFGANQVELRITNNGGTLGFITHLQARGRGLYDYNPIDALHEDTSSITEIGKSQLLLDMPYQADLTVANVVAEFLLATWSAVGPSQAEMKFTPRDQDEYEIAFSIEPGDAIAITEEMTAINNVYFVQSVGLTINEPGIDNTEFRFTLQRALVEDYWQLGIAGFSELGMTTVLAPL